MVLPSFYKQALDLVIVLSTHQQKILRGFFLLLLTMRLMLLNKLMHQIMFVMEIRMRESQILLFKIENHKQQSQLVNQSYLSNKTVSKSQSQLLILQSFKQKLIQQQVEQSTKHLLFTLIQQQHTYPYIEKHSYNTSSKGDITISSSRTSSISSISSRSSRITCTSFSSLF